MICKGCGSGELKKHGTYTNKRGLRVQRVRCRRCGQSQVAHADEPASGLSASGRLSRPSEAHEAFLALLRRYFTALGIPHAAELAGREVGIPRSTSRRWLLALRPEQWVGSEGTLSERDRLLADALQMLREPRSVIGRAQVPDGDIEISGRSATVVLHTMARARAIAGLVGKRVPVGSTASVWQRQEAPRPNWDIPLPKWIDLSLQGRGWPAWARHVMRYESRTLTRVLAELEYQVLADPTLDIASVAGATDWFRWWLQLEGRNLFKDGMLPRESPAYHLWRRVPPPTGLSEDHLGDIIEEYRVDLDLTDDETMRIESDTNAYDRKWEQDWQEERQSESALTYFLFLEQRHVAVELSCRGRLIGRDQEELPEVVDLGSDAARYRLVPPGVATPTEKDGIWDAVRIPLSEDFAGPALVLRR